ncbi:hypothetical protein [Brevibacillus migulae]|uniref:hypothetical protein n=1 Tax=Brevibacillus migulae TaxID=1644114 RepID=UPI00106E8A87|nr:hypothetical protein [Brevibacillus migulae]
MKEIDEKIAQVRAIIVEATLALIELEKERETALQLMQERSQYVSSQEIIDLIFQSCGRQTSLATIKRWADHGFLGEILNERERFPTLVHKQGNKRFLYRKDTVYSFLAKKGLLRPRFEVLDLVCLREDPTCRGMVVEVNRLEASFLYTIQLEGSQKTMAVKQEDLMRQEGHPL